MGLWRRAPLLVVLGLLTTAWAAGAQEDCRFLPGTGSVNVAGAITYMSSALLSCEGGTMQVRADSVMVYNEQRIHQLFGNVFFETDEVRVSSQTAQYYAASDLILAEGNVDLLRKADGTSITGGEKLEYFMTGSTVTTEQLTVTGGRPHAVLHPAAPEDPAPDAPPGDPYEVDADRIVVRGGEDFEARGRVLIRRGDLTAGGEAVDYFANAEQLRLSDGAHLDTERFDMTGGVIVISMNEGEVSQVTSTGGSELTGEDLILTGPRIRLEMDGDQLERVTASQDPQAALPGERPLAVSEDFRIAGDSLDIEVSGETLRRVTAVGAARTESAVPPPGGGTDVPEVASSDWIEGDTVLAEFTPPPEVPDSAVAPELPPSAGGADPPAEAQTSARLERLVAIGGARAFYRMPPSDTTEVEPATDTTSAAAEPGDPAAEPAPDAAAEPQACTARFAVHYVTGDAIIVSFSDGEVGTMEVTGSVGGWHLEPPAGSACTPAVREVR